MNEDFSIKRKTIYYLAFFIIGLITFYPLFTTGFGCADDVQNYLITLKKEFAHNSGYLAQMSGRFYYYIVYIVLDIPYLWDNTFIMKLFQILPILAGLLLFVAILRKITNSTEFSYLFLLIFLVTMQISGYTSLFLTYPLYFTFAFDLILLSLLLLLIYLKREKNWILILASVIFGLGLLFYETFLIYGFILYLVILAVKYEKGGTFFNWIKRTILPFLPFLVVMIIYLAIYFIFRIYHPSIYDGSTFTNSKFSFALFFKTIWGISYTAFPLTIWGSSLEIFKTQTLLIDGFRPVVLDVIVHGKAEWLVKAILVVMTGGWILLRVEKINHRLFFTGIGVSVLMIFLPQFPLGLTPKYTFYAKVGMIGYIPTYFSLFGSVLLITLLIGYLIQWFDFSKILKRIVIWIIMTGFFVCSYLTDFTNDTVARDVRSANLRFYAMDEMIKNDRFATIPSGSDVFGKDLYNNPSFSAHFITEQSFNWSDYIGLKSGKFLNVFREDKEFETMVKDSTKEVYLFTCHQAAKDESVLLGIGKLLRPIEGDSLHLKLTDRGLFSYYSLYKIFTVSFRVKDPTKNPQATFKINHIPAKWPSGESVTLTIYNTDVWSRSTTFAIEIPWLDIYSVTVSNIVDPANPVFYL